MKPRAPHPTQLARKKRVYHEATTRRSRAGLAYTVLRVLGYPSEGRRKGHKAERRNLCALAGVKNTGRQWRKLRKAQRREEQEMRRGRA